MKFSKGLFLSILNFVFLFISFGCYTTPISTAPSLNPLIQENGQTKKYTIVGEVDGTSQGFNLFIFQIAKVSFDDAIVDALSKVDADDLINLRFTRNDAMLLPGLFISNLDVKAIAIKYEMPDSLKKNWDGGIPNKQKPKVLVF